MAIWIELLVDNLIDVPHFQNVAHLVRRIQIYYFLYNFLKYLASEYGDIFMNLFDKIKSMISNFVISHFFTPINLYFFRSFWKPASYSMIIVFISS